MSSGGILHHRVDGTGEPLLLLNGIAMTMAAWEPVAGPLARRFRVIRCDLRGQLGSPGPPPADLAGHVADVAALLEILDAAPAHVLATSFGALVAVMLAAGRPELIRSLILVAAADRIDRAMQEEVERWRAACREALSSGDRRHLVDVMHPAAFSEEFRRRHAAALAARRSRIQELPDRWLTDLDALMASIEHVDLRPELAAVRCPTLVVAARHDGFIPRERTEALAAAIPGARLTVLEGAGHAAVVEKPLTIVRLVESL
ncbi:MAG: alpha/beta fold hydrolase [Acidobacteria bacterium]|nr:alpha/beta fold hydrolase [Acidobacteriota bacterium]